MKQSPKIEFFGHRSLRSLCRCCYGFSLILHQRSCASSRAFPVRKVCEAWFSSQIRDTWRTTDKITEFVRKSSTLRLTFVHARNDRIVHWRQADGLFHAAASATVDGGLKAAEIDRKKSTVLQGEGSWEDKWISEQKQISRVLMLRGGEEEWTLG